jgi:hypothetical protein
VGHRQKVFDHGEGMIKQGDGAQANYRRSETLPRRILKSFGMYYGKPYPRDHRRPADAKRLLKKTPSDEQAHGARVPG